MVHSSVKVILQDVARGRKEGRERSFGHIKLIDRRVKQFIDMSIQWPRSHRKTHSSELEILFDLLGCLHLYFPTFFLFK